MRLHPGYSILLGRAFRPQPRTPEVTLADRPTGAGQPKRNLVADWLRASPLQNGQPFAIQHRSGRPWRRPFQRDPAARQIRSGIKSAASSMCWIEPQMGNPAARDGSSPPAEEDQQACQAAT